MLSYLLASKSPCCGRDYDRNVMAMERTRAVVRNPCPSGHWLRRGELWFIELLLIRSLKPPCHLSMRLQLRDEGVGMGEGGVVGGSWRTAEGEGLGGGRRELNC